VHGSARPALAIERSELPVADASPLRVLLEDPGNTLVFDGRGLSALAPPVGQVGSPPPVGSGGAHAEAAALAERMLTSLRIGRVGRDGVEVRMRLARESGDELEVRVREIAGRLEAELIGMGVASELEVLAERLRRELGDRGYDFDALHVTME
jgi:hypothetical protein